MVAAIQGRIQAVGVLIDSGADLSIPKQGEGARR